MKKSELCFGEVSDGLLGVVQAGSQVGHRPEDRVLVVRSPWWAHVSRVTLSTCLDTMDPFALVCSCSVLRAVHEGRVQAGVEVDFLGK